MRVLVFEDEPQLRLRISQLLEEQGYTVMSFAAPSKAMESLEEPHEFPKLALLDIKMDNLSTSQVEEEIRKGFPQETAGIELAKRILIKKKIPIIFLTAYGSLFDDALSVGPKVFFEKGKIDLASVVKNINQAIFNYQNDEVYRPNFRLLPEGKICINYNPGGGRADGPVFRRVIIKIDDILFYEADGTITRIFVKDRDNPFVLGMQLGSFNSQLETVIHQKNKGNPFYQVYRGKYANMNLIVSYDQENIYFSANSDRLQCPLNRSSYHYISQELFPPFKG